ncbi:MAG TPA: YceI family protein [Chloroflexota bacterium]|jgi:polyisoprenoid-binding protein YceI|nr:YceI family protein [Chloroflexota bacterium]
MATNLEQQTTTWVIDPAHSLVEFSVRHMMFTTVKGRFGKIEGTIVEDNADPSRSSVNVTIEAESIDTRDDRRDTHLRSADFLHIDEHSTITFKSTRVEPKGNEHFLVHGDLTIRGATRPVTLDVTRNGTGTNPFGMTVAGFTAETKINRKDFGLVWNMGLETGGVLVGDEVKILIEVQAAKQ